MMKKHKVSRRCVLGSIAASPSLLSATIPIDTSLIDALLVSLGREFDELSELFNRSIEHDYWFSDETGKRFGEVIDAIESTPATTIEGLCVKARVACWSLLGDLDTPKDADLDQCMASSILRDLVRLHRPDLEQPGAIKKMITEIENGASQGS